MNVSELTTNFVCIEEYHSLLRDLSKVSAVLVARVPRFPNDDCFNSYTVS